MELSQIDPQIIADDCPKLILGPHLKTGGQKRVWRCAYKGKAYVLKALMVDQETRRRVKREIQVMRACASPYLPRFGPIPLRELGLKEGSKILYFLEEYIEGTPLDSVYKPMPYAEVARLGLCVAEALATLAMNGYLHRDVKPMNIIQKSPTHFILIDAGLALDPDGDAITMPGKVVGTRAYLSPDQITLPQKKLDIRSDFFCLGPVLYEAATGEHPFWNEETPKGDIIHNILNFECVSPVRFNAGLPTTLAAITMKLLRKNRNERYLDFKELHDALAPLVQDGQNRSPAQGESEASQRRNGKRTSVRGQATSRRRI
jgi:serine/threonine protein kinase